MEGVTVVIPTYNVENTIEESLEGIIRQDYSGEIEILVVDGGSVDSTLDILNRYEKNHQNLRVIDGEELDGYAAQINEGIRQSEHENICFLNADCVPESEDWLKKLVEALEPEEDIVGAQPIAKIPEKLVENSSLSYRLFYGSRKPEEVEEVITRPFNFQPNGYVCKKSVLEEVDLLDEEHYKSAGEDYDLSLRIQLKGYKSTLVPVVLLHYHGKGEEFGFKDYLTKHMQQSEGQGVIMRRYPFAKRYPIWNEFTKSVLYISLFIPLLNLATIPIFLLYLNVYTYSVRKVLNGLEFVYTPFMKVPGDMANILGFYKGFIRKKQDTIPIALRGS